MNVIMCAESSLAFLFHKGLLINVTYLGTQAAECMASYLSTGEWLPDPILFSGVTAGWWKCRLPGKNKYSGFMVAGIILDFHS